MVTTVIGRMFLKAYNEKYESNYDAKTFFIEKFYPLFFANEKYFFRIQNSPMDQDFSKVCKGDQTVQGCLEKLVHEIESMSAEPKMDAIFDASKAVGFPAKDTLKASNSQVSIAHRSLDPEVAYYSWIGAGFGVGVLNGKLNKYGIKKEKDKLDGLVTLLFFHPTILLSLFEGWGVYRTYLDKDTTLNSRQIYAWNSYWLLHNYSSIDFISAIVSDKNKNETKLKYFNWIQILTAISKGISNPSCLAYVYKLDRVNATLGSIPIFLSPIRRSKELYDQLFSNTFDKAIDLYRTHYAFSTACIAGQIGLKQIQPELLVVEKPIKKSYSEEERVKLNIYLTWLLAMLNNEQLWEKSIKYAQALFDYENSQTGTSRENKVKALFEVQSKRNAIQQLALIIEDNSGSDFELLELSQLIHSMPYDNLKYLIALIRLQYVVIKKEQLKK